MVKKIILASGLLLNQSHAATLTFDAPTKIAWAGSCSNRDLSKIGDLDIEWHYYAIAVQKGLKVQSLYALMQIDTCLLPKYSGTQKQLIRAVADKLLEYKERYDDFDFKNDVVNHKNIDFIDEKYAIRLLTKWEGDYFHYNKSEKSYTTPYGVYRHYHRDSDIIKYSDSLFRKYHLPMNRKGCRLLNRKLTNSEKSKIKHLAFANFKDKYLNHLVTKTLLNKRLYKTAVSFISYRYNAGKLGSTRIFAKALGVKPRTRSKIKGYFKYKGWYYPSSYTLASLVKLSPLSDSKLNRRVYNSGVRYYKERPKSKRKLFLRGWLIRARSLL